MAKKKTSRKGISKKTRIEVFKRDSFRCRYCGKKPTDDDGVVLHLDHIKPVAKGGDNNILNLVTSCFDCNMGKSDRELNDSTVIDMQHEQLDKLNELRIQQEWMYEWQQELLKSDDAQINSFENLIKTVLDSDSFSLNNNGKKAYKKLFKKYGFDKTVDALKISHEQYAKFDEDNEITDESVNVILNKIDGILFTKSQPEHKQKMRYIRGILNNRLDYVNQQNAIDAMEDAYSRGIDLEWIQDYAKRVRNWTEFERTMYSMPSNEDISSTDNKPDKSQINLVENSPKPVPKSIVNEDEIYIADFIVNVVDFFIEKDKLTFRVSLDSSFKKDELPKTTLPEYKNIHSKKPSLIDDVVGVLDGYLLEYGLDYVIDIPVNHPLVIRYLNVPDIKLTDFLFDIAEGRSFTEVDDNDWGNEYLGEAVLVSLGCGPCYFPCVISE